VIVVPFLEAVGVGHAGFVQHTHGPPLSAWLTRGPPFLA
jgi:hypothetical protein